MEEEKLSIEDREFERQRQERNNDVLNERALKERLKKQKMQVRGGEGWAGAKRQQEQEHYTALLHTVN